MLTTAQATAVMAAGIPVMFRGMEYLRIIGVSHMLTDHNVVIPSVTMEDRFRKTVYHGSPEEITMHGEIDGVYYVMEGDTVKAVREERGIVT